MNNSDEQPFAALMVLAGAATRQAVETVTLDTYFSLLEEYEFADVSHAVRQHLLNPDRGQFFPKVADLIAVLSGSQAVRSAAAWGLVLRAIHAAGSYRNVDFGDVTIAAAITGMGGWPAVCRIETEYLMYAQHRFTLLRQTAEHQPDGDGVTLVRGLQGSDEEFLKIGRRTPPTVYFGLGGRKPKALPQALPKQVAVPADDEFEPRRMLTATI